MPLYINDEEVDALVEELRSLKRTTKTKAVKMALKGAVEQTRQKSDLRLRLTKTFQLARKAGPFASNDYAHESDDHWREP